MPQKPKKSEKRKKKGDRESKMKRKRSRFWPMKTSKNWWQLNQIQSIKSQSKMLILMRCRPQKHLTPKLFLKSKNSKERLQKRRKRRDLRLKGKLVRNWKPKRESSKKKPNFKENLLRKVKRKPNWNKSRRQKLRQRLTLKLLKLLRLKLRKKRTKTLKLRREKLKNWPI